MAAAEARAVWQRTVNRYFVQEDAKRAPKLACCQSSSSSSKQVDVENSNAAEGGDRHPVDFSPLNGKPSFSNIPSDTIWWLHYQPCYGLPKGLTCERLNALDYEEGIMKDDPMKLDDNLSRETDKTSPCFKKKRSYEPLPERCDSVLVNNISQQSMGAKEKINSMSDEDAKARKNMDIVESYEFVEMDATLSSSKEPDELGLAMDNPCIENSKPQPWWRTTDKDHLASFVASKSHDHIMNCDLPPPRKVHVRRHPYLAVGGLHDGVSKARLDSKVKPSSMSSPEVFAQTEPPGCPDFGQACQRYHALAVDGCFWCGSNQAYGRSSSSTAHTTSGETHDTTDYDPAKAQLLEALRHSQTRAREAEKVAKQLHAEKEHIIKLIFRQASQLFAYRQWFQLLQLETLYLQIKNNDEPISTIFPVGVVLPWNHHRGKRLRKNWHKAPKARHGKRGRPEHDITKFSLMFAVGLGLVGAGLLLGWTVGWMLPLF